MEALPIFQGCYGERFIDMNFWVQLTHVNLFNDGNISIGIKGIPGRYGIGAGHTRLRNMPRDNGWKYLTYLIGIEDVKLYTKYYGGGTQSSSALFQRNPF
jgi:hypothetical protein